MQQLLQTEAGIQYPLVIGGYKAGRRFLMNELERSVDTRRTELVIVSGKTGVGKTRVLDELGPHHCIDLEGLAHHRGSTFGAMPEDPDQPSQIDFENSVSIALLKLLAAADADGMDAAEDSSEHSSTIAKNANQQTEQQQNVRVYVEDEGSRIGHVSLPSPLWDRMKTCDKMVIVEEDIEERVDVILQDYIIDLGRRFVTVYGKERGPQLHRDRLLGDLKRLRKLGGDRLERLIGMLEAAFIDQASLLLGETTSVLFREFVVTLLEQYYDPMYEHHIKQHGEDCKVIFRGTRKEVVEWAMLEKKRAESYKGGSMNANAVVEVEDSKRNIKEGRDGGIWIPSIYCIPILAGVVYSAHFLWNAKRTRTCR